jgi:hypothetical protein
MINWNRLPLGIFGFIGSFVPTIIKMFNNLSNIAFVVRWEWLVVICLYGFIGGLAAVIYPYKNRPTAWRALLLGSGFPALIGAASAIGKGDAPGTGLGSGDTAAAWSPLDFITLF